MKKSALLLITLLSITLLSAQENNDEIKTLFGKVDNYGGYGAITTCYTQIDNKNAMVIGGKGALIIDHHFSIGLGGYGFFNDYSWDELSNSNVDIQGGCGGLYFESILLPRFPVHLSIPLFLGVGGVAYVKDNYSSYEYYSGYIVDEEAFVIAEPGLELEMNMFKFMRISLGAYYRYTSEIKLINTDKDILNGLSTGISFKFGGF